LKVRLEDSPRDCAAPAAALLTDATMPGQRYYRLLASRNDGAEKQQHLMDGVTTSIGDNRRKLAGPEKDATALLDNLRTRRNLLALAEQWNDTNKAFSQISPTLAKLPDDQAALAAHALAGLYVRRGQWQLAREAYLLMVDRYPTHPLAVDAYRWLIRHNASSEARRRHEKGQFLMVADVGFSPLAKPDPKNPVQIVNGTEKLFYLSNLTETRQWNRGSLEVGKRLIGFGPLYAADPSMQMCLQAARRNLGELKEAQEWSRKLVNLLPKGPWQEAAAAEVWLTNRTASPPKRVGLCRQTAQKPFLDGNLDDACWQNHQPMTLTNAVGDTAKDYAADAMFSFDQQYLYVALRCRHPQGDQVPLLAKRPRDADLDAFDRVSILLDLDRDYSTYFRLEVDQRGQVREDCWGDLSWNPKWYVAVKQQADGWVAEIAIPMDELTSDRVTVNTAWAVNVVRTLPGRGVQGWSLPADADPRPEGMGLLMFQQDQPRQPRPEGPMSRVP
jgi:tetratricopeptide (TPR) repeat protein